MAIRSKAETHRPEATIVCEVGEFKGNETFSVGIEGGNPKFNLSAGPAKWARLFMLDADGDSVMMNLLQWLREHRSDFAELCSNMDEFVQQFEQMKTEWFGSDEPVTEEEAPLEPETAESTPESGIVLTEGDLANARKLLSTQTKLWRVATEVQQQFLAADCAWCLKSGQAWNAYRVNLTKFMSVQEYSQSLHAND